MPSNILTLIGCLTGLLLVAYGLPVFLQAVAAPILGWMTYHSLKQWMVGSDQ